MAKVTWLEDFKLARYEGKEEAMRTELRQFGVDLANWSFEAGCPYPLSLQSIASGWEGYRTMSVVTGWWLVAVIPGIIEREGADGAAHLPFYNYRSNKNEAGEYPLIGEVKMERCLRQPPLRQDNIVQVLEDALDQYPLSMVKVPLLAFSAFMYMARKDMGFVYRSLEVTDTTITIVIEAISERMTITLYPEQFASLLVELKEGVKKNSERTGEPDTTDWSIYDPK